MFLLSRVSFNGKKEMKVINLYLQYRKNSAIFNWQKKSTIGEYYGKK